MTTITVNNLTKTYKLYSSPGAMMAEAFTRAPKHTLCKALDGLSFKVEAGEAVGIIGRNGSGKSSLLKILAGVIDPTEGNYEINGRIAPLLDLGAGFVPGLTAKENISLNGRLLGFSKKEITELTPAILDFAELGEFAAQPIRTYSSGMLLRLGFAIAQSVEPDVLLIDEILAVGDAAFQKKCLARVEEFRSRGASALIVSHSMADIGGLTSRVIQLDRGRIVREGSAEDVIEGYLDDLRGSAADSGAPLWRVQNPHRRKTGEVTIVSAGLLNSEGEPTQELRTGSPARVVIEFKTNKPVEKPMFRVQIFRSDGLFAHGTNTYRHGIDMGVLDSDGRIEVVYDKITLLEGRYWLTVGIYPDEFGKAVADHAYDVLDPAFSFEVKSDREHGAGVVGMPHKWVIDK